MATSTDERNRILNLVEARQITALEAAQLLDALLMGDELSPGHERSGARTQNRTIRVWMSDLATRRKRVNVTATMPLNLIKATLSLLAHLAPQLNNNIVQNMIDAIETGATGRLLDLQDLEEGKRIEVFIE
jgi:hypothetical protein